MNQLRDATKNILKLVEELAASLRRSTLQSEGRFPFTPPVAAPTLAVAVADRARTHYTPAYISNSEGILDMEGFVPIEAIIDTGASKAKCNKKFAAAMKIYSNSLKPGSMYVIASGKVEMPLGITRPLKFTPGRGTEHEMVIETVVTVVDTTAYDILLGMDFVAAALGGYDSYTELFTYRWEDRNRKLREHSITTPCHTTTPPVMGYACFSGLISSEAKLEDVQSSCEESILEEEEEKFGYHSSPHQLAVAQLSRRVEADERENEVRVSEEVRGHDLVRRENAATRLAAVTPLSLPPLLPSSKWLGEQMLGATPINTATRKFSEQSIRDGLHVVELFGGVGLGVLRTALAAGYSVRCYTYVDRNATSRRIARATLQALQLQYLSQLRDAAINAFDKRLPQNISQYSTTFMELLLERHGPVDLLGGSWECQSVSRVGKQRGTKDPRFRFFYDLIRIVNFIQRDQASPMIYLLENTYPRERCSKAVRKASELVQAFIGAPVLINAADLGAAAHRVRLFWSNMLQPAVLQATLATMVLPSPPLAAILSAITCRADHATQITGRSLPTTRLGVHAYACLR